MTQHTLRSNFDTVLLPPKELELLDRSRVEGKSRLVDSEPAFLPVIGVHPAVIKIAMSAVVGFLAVAWFDFFGGPEVDLNLAVITGFFIMFFTLVLLATSMVIDDPRWKQPKARFAEFLNDQIPVDRGTLRGRDVLIQITSLPVVPGPRGDAYRPRLAPAILAAFACGWSDAARFEPQRVLTDCRRFKTARNRASAPSL
jgi:hypothetical protein